MFFIYNLAIFLKQQIKTNQCYNLEIKKESIVVNQQRKKEEQFVTKLIKPLDITLVGCGSFNDLLEGNVWKETIYNVQDSNEVVALIKKARELSKDGVSFTVEAIVSPASICVDSSNDFLKKGLELFPKRYLTVFEHSANKERFDFGDTAEEIATRLNEEIAHLTSFKFKAKVTTVNVWVCPKCKSQCNAPIEEKLICKSCLSEVEAE